MCDDDDCPTIDIGGLALHTDVAPGPDPELSKALVASRGISDPFSRREVLRVGSLAAALAVLAQGTTRPARASGTTTTLRSALTLPDGASSTRHAMHVHSIGSEKLGSVSGQVSLAEQWSCDHLWMTEHDWRLFAPDDERVPREYVFTGLSAGGWDWRPVQAGKPSRASAGVVAVPSAGTSALRLQITATTPATVGVTATSDTQLFEGMVVGRQIVLPLQVDQLSGTAYVELVVRLSYHGPVAQTLVYRFGSRADQRVRVSKTLGHVYQQVAAGTTTEVTLTPLDDIEAIFGGELVAADNSITGLTLQVSAQEGSVRAFIPRIGLPRFVTGEAALDALVSVYDEVFAGSSVTRRHAIEVSGSASHHLGWYGPDATNLPEPDLKRAVRTIHAGPGIVSYNHPFGTGSPPRTDERILQVLARLAKPGLYGVDALELGYDQRGGMSLDDHLLLGDLLWNRGLVFTANGVSDDHNSRDWGTSFLTHLWGDGTETSDLAALRSGRTSVNRLTFLGDLAVTLDGRPMGSVPSRRVTRSGELTVYTSGLPADATLQVVTGATDTTGPYGVVPRTTARSIRVPVPANGSVSVTVGGGYVYHRVVARDGDGSVIAFTNPVWAGVPDVSAVEPSRVVRV